MQFWSNMIIEKNAESVLELACGTGRLANVFLRENAHYTGIDIIPHFLKIAKKKINPYFQKATFIHENITKFNFNKKYDLILIAFNSFLHLLTNEEIDQSLNQIKLHMHDQTHFIIDIFIPNPLFLYKPKNYKSKVLEFFDSKKKELVYIEEINDYDPATDINKITWFFSTKNELNYDKRHFSMRMLFPSTINSILIDHGFKICSVWGDYNKAKLNEGSKLQIYDLMLNSNS